MNDRDLGVQEQSSEIENRIEKALEELDLIQKEKNLVKTADELEALERRIVDATDKLAGALVAQKVQASIDSKELKDEAAVLAKTYPRQCHLTKQDFEDLVKCPSHERRMRSS